MRKLICIVWVALLLFLSNVTDIGDMRAYAVWNLRVDGEEMHSCNAALFDHRFTSTKNTYLFRGNCRRYSQETAFPPEPIEVSAQWDQQTKTLKEWIRLSNRKEGQIVAGCSDDPWLNYLIPHSFQRSGSIFEIDPLEFVGRGGLRPEIPITPWLLTSAQMNDLRAEWNRVMSWLNSDVEIVHPTYNYSFASPDRVAFSAKVKSDLPAPDNAVMLFRISENRWPNPNQPPIKVYEKSQKILRNGYANLLFKELFPGEWIVVARIQSSQGPGSPPTQFSVEGSPVPTNLKAELTGKWQVCEHRNVKLTWQAPDAGQRGFAIERRKAQPDKSSTFNQIATVAWDKREYVDTSDKFGGEYYYRVKALYTAAESIYTDAAKIVLEKVHKPNPPTNLRSVSGSQVGINAPIKLSWKDNSDNEDFFAIDRKDPGSDKFRELHITGPNVQEWTDSSSKPVAGFYTYHIRVISKGCSSNSNTISVQVGTPASAPKGMREIK